MVFLIHRNHLIPKIDSICKDKLRIRKMLQLRKNDTQYDTNAPAHRIVYPTFTSSPFLYIYLFISVFFLNEIFRNASIEV